VVAPCTHAVALGVVIHLFQTHAEVKPRFMNRTLPKNMSAHFKSKFTASVLPWDQFLLKMLEAPIKGEKGSAVRIVREQEVRGAKGKGKKGKSSGKVFSFMF
jgi:hypothetical protein